MRQEPHDEAYFQGTPSVLGLPHLLENMKKAKYRIQLIVCCPECKKFIGCSLDNLKGIEDINKMNILKCPHCLEEFELGERTN